MWWRTQYGEVIGIILELGRCVGSPKVQTSRDIFKGFLNDVFTPSVIQRSDDIVDDDRKFTRIDKADDHVALRRGVLRVRELGQIQRIGKIWGPSIRIGHIVHFARVNAESDSD
jgi:hypothetical protein